MFPRRFISVTLTLAMANAAASLDTRLGPLEVKAGKGGAPCFTIPQAHERAHGAPHFESITVHAADSPKAPAWTMAMPEQRSFRLRHLMCIPYAGRLPVLPKTPADPLATNKVYVVTIRTADAPRLYRARFCLADAPPQVRQLAPDAAPNAACPR